MAMISIDTEKSIFLKIDFTIIFSPPDTRTHAHTHTRARARTRTKDFLLNYPFYLCKTRPNLNMSTQEIKRKFFLLF